MDENKKKTAAITAVLYYLQTEEETSIHELSSINTSPSHQDSFWTFSGRQSQMLLRNMAQMKLFPGWKG